MKLNKTSLLVAAVVVVVIYLLGLIVGLPGWAAVFASVVVLLVLALLWRPTEEKPVPVPTPLPQQPAPREREPVFEGPPSRTISDVRLPSASPEYEFRFSAIVHWSTVRSGTRHADLGSVAVDALLQRANAATADRQPGEESLQQHRLAALLGEPDLDEKGQVRTWATEVRLRLPDADLKHLQRVAALRRHEQTALLERRLEQSKRSYLRNDVLATPGSAVVWWLANHPGEVEKCAGLVDLLSRLSAAAHDRTGDPGSAAAGQFDFDGAVDLLLDGHNDLERALKAYSLADLEARFNRLERADRIRELHDVDQPPAMELMPPSNTSPPSAPEPPSSAPEPPSSAAGLPSDAEPPTARPPSDSGPPGAAEPPDAEAPGTAEEVQPSVDSAERRRRDYRERFSSE